METVQTKSWLSRNWPWVVPTGGCLVVILVFIFFVSSMFFGLTTILKDTDPYQMALEKATNHTEVAAVLGKPIEASAMMKGNINYTDGNGVVHFNIPIQGPEGSGDILVMGTKTGDENWVYTTLEVSFDTADTVVNLLEPQP